MSIKINKTVLIKENNWKDTQKVEYREYEWEDNGKIIVHYQLIEEIPKEKLSKMYRKSVFEIAGRTFDLNVDHSVSLMTMGDLNPEEQAAKEAADAKSARLQALQDKINKRLRDKKR
jgi:hypothetical protein